MAPSFCAGAYPWGKTAKALPTRGLGWVGLAASCRSKPSGAGFLSCLATRLNNLTVRFQGRADYRQPPDPSKRMWAEDTVILCVGARADRGVGGGWALRVGGKCDLVLQARWGRPWEPDAGPTGE